MSGQGAADGSPRGTLVKDIEDADGESLPSLEHGPAAAAAGVSRARSENDWLRQEAAAAGPWDALRAELLQLRWHIRDDVQAILRQSLSKLAPAADPISSITECTDVASYCRADSTPPSPSKPKLELAEREARGGRQNDFGFDGAQPQLPGLAADSPLSLGARKESDCTPSSSKGGVARGRLGPDEEEPPEASPPATPSSPLPPVRHWEEAPSVVPPIPMLPETGPETCASFAPLVKPPRLKKARTTMLQKTARYVASKVDNTRRSRSSRTSKVSRVSSTSCGPSTTVTTELSAVPCVPEAATSASAQVDAAIRPSQSWLPNRGSLAFMRRMSTVGTNNKHGTTSSEFAYLKPGNIRGSAEFDLIPEDEEVPLLKRIVQSPLFDFVSAMVIVCNAITIGAQADYEARHSTPKVPEFFVVAEKVFCVIFTLELITRFVAYRLQFFAITGCAWGLFDIFVVSMQLVEEVLLLFWHSGTGSTGNMSFMRLLRILRLVRILRVLRIIRFMDELRSLVVSIGNSMRSLFWTLTLLVLGVYAVGVYFTQLVADYRIESTESGRQDDPALVLYFGGLASSMLSLYQAMTGGIDWGDLSEPLVDHLSPFQGLVLTGYIAFTVLALTNVVTGVFVEGALKSAQEDEEQFFITRLHEIFLLCDVNRTGKITTQDFQMTFNTEGMRKLMEGAKIDHQEAAKLFHLLDSDGNDTVDYDEFVGGCARLRGAARAMDLMVLMHESTVNHKRTVEMMQTLSDQICSLAALNPLLSQDVRTILSSRGAPREP